MKEKTNIAILGLGSWGMALGMVLDDNNCNVKIWDINAERAKNLMISKKFDLLNWINIPENINLSGDILNVINFAVPSNAIRNVSEKLKEVIQNKKIDISDKIFLSVAKGMENETYLY